MNLLLKPKNYLIVSMVSVLLLTTAGYLAKNIAGQQVFLYKVNSGLGICQQRIAQTYTALMIKDLGSQYLQNDFKQMTGECFNEVSSMLSHELSDISLNTMINNLKSDLHWFNQKIERVLEMVKKDNVDLSESNISGKFSELEELGSKLEDNLLSRSHGLENTSVLVQLAGLFSFILLILSAGSFLFDRRLKKSLAQKVDELLAEAIDLNQEENLNLVLNSVSSEKAANLLRTYIIEMKNEKIQMEEKILLAQTEHEVPLEQRYEINTEVNLAQTDNKLEVYSEQKQITNFQLVINLLLDRIRPRIFHEAILLETDLSDEFFVYSEQGAVEQLLFSLLEYSMDCVKTVKDTKKVKFCSKALGGIAYCKVAICQYQFNDQDKAFLSGTMSQVQNMPINLILLRELVKDSGVRLAVKNKHNGQKGTFEAEVEIIFDRADVDHAQTNTIVKGSKADIKKYFEGTV